MSHEEENDGSPAPAQTGAAVTGLAWSLERAPNTGSSRMTNHNKIPARHGSLSPNPRLNRRRVLDIFCTTMIKLSPWGGRFVSSWDLCSNFFRQVCLNWVFSPRALLVGFTPARSLEAKQTAALASYGFPQQHQKLARDQSGSSEAATLSVSLSHNTTICKTSPLPIVMGAEHEGVCVGKKAAVNRKGMEPFFLFAAVRHHCFQKLSCSALAYFSVPGGSPPAVHLAKAKAPADWPTRTLRQASVHLYSTLAAQLPTSPWGPSLPRGPGASCVPAS